MQDVNDMISLVAVQDVGGVRAGGVLTKRLDLPVEQLAVNVNVFLNQMGQVLAKTPDIEGFQLSEVEVSAEISVTGQLVLWGVGGQVGGNAGIKFVFKKGR